MPWTGDDWEAYAVSTGIGSISGWTAGGDGIDSATVRTESGSKRAGTSFGTEWFERTMDASGDLDYDFEVGGGSTLTVKKNGTPVNTHSTPGTGSDTLSGLATSDVVRFEISANATSWVDNLVYTASGLTLDPNDIDLPIENESPTLAAKWAVDPNDTNLAVENDHPTLGVGWSITVNNVDLAIENESPTVGIGNWLSVNDVDLAIENQTFEVAVFNDLLVRSVQLTPEVSRPTLGVNFSLDVNDVDIAIENESLSVQGSKTIAVNNVDLAIENESFDTVLHYALSVADVDLPIENEPLHVYPSSWDVDALDQPGLLCHYGLFVSSRKAFQ